MFREVALLSGAVVFLELAAPGAHGAPVRELRPHRTHATHVTAMHVAPVSRVEAARHEPRVTFAVSARAEPKAAVVAAAYQLPAPALDPSAGAPTSLAYQVPPPGDVAADDAASQVPPVLSDQEKEASQMAAARGDRDFLMVDKALGKILLFEQGQPVFSGPALTGESLSDELPAGELNQKFDNLYALNTKVTPAGRFTVARGYDKELGGPLLDVSEIRGKDWGIAIHQVYLGTPSEHRDIRIKSPSPDDKHISFGCINVTPSAIKYLLREIPESGSFPLYILPEDVTQTAAYFAPPTS